MKEILIVQAGKLGDMVLTTPLLEAVISTFPDARVSLLCSPKNDQLLAADRRISKIFTYRKSPAAVIRLFFELRKRKFDLVIDAKDHRSSETRFLAALAGGKRAVGYVPPGEKSPFTDALPICTDENCSVTWKNLLALSPFADPASFSRVPVLHAQPEMLERNRLKYGSLENSVLLNLSAGDPSRIWPLEKWETTAKHIAALGFPILVSAMASENETAEELCRTVPSAVRFEGSLQACVAMISEVRLVVTPDTAIVHIASAFNRDQVALFPPVQWNFYRFAPLSERFEQITPEPGTGFAEIPAEAVISAVNRLLKISTP